MTQIFLNNLSDLIEIQRASFYRFLYEGIGQELKLLPNPTLKRRRGYNKKNDEDLEENPLEEDLIKEKSFEEKIDQEIEIPDDISPFSFYLYRSKIKIIGPLKSLLNCIEFEKTYTTNIYIEGEVTIPLHQKAFNNSCFTNRKKKGKRSSGVEKLQITEGFSEFTYQRLSLRKAFFLTSIPFLTEDGSFYVNGCERVVVSQIKKSPGIYFKKEFLTSNQISYMATLISEHGSWTNFRLSDSIARVKMINRIIDESLEENLSFEEIENELKQVPLEYDIYIKMRDLRIKKASIFDVEDPKEIFLFDFLSYLGLSFDEILDGLKYPERINFQELNKNLASNFSWNSQDELELNNAVDNKKTPLFFFEHLISPIKSGGLFSIGKVGRYRINKRLGLNLPLSVTSLTSYDLLRIIDLLVQFREDNFSADDIDDLKNKQIRGIGELLQNQIRLGLLRWKLIQESKELTWSLVRKLDQTQNDFDSDFTTVATGKRSEKSFKKMLISDLRKNQQDEFELSFLSNLTSKLMLPYGLKSSIDNSLREFFLLSPLSQYFDQTNPLAELAQKRRISVFGPNGLQRDKISTKMRDIHPSQYGKLCPVETPEGENVGLVMALSSFARVSSLGWIETPYFLVEKGQVLFDQKVLYLNPHQEAFFSVAFANNPLQKNREFLDDYIPVKEGPYFFEREPQNVEFSAISPLQIFSIGTNLVPFVEHNDANRALMGSNMQKQAVPLFLPQNPLVGTGFEGNIVLESGLITKSESEGTVIHASSYFIEIMDLNKQIIRYKLLKYFASNQETCINQKALVWPGEKVYSGQIIADGPASLQGELALGKNLTIGYLPWEGYNYEDAIVISESIVNNDLLTSLHISECDVTVDLSLTHFIKVNQALRFHRKQKILKKWIENIGEKLIIEDDEKNIYLYKNIIQGILNRIRFLRKVFESILGDSIKEERLNSEEVLIGKEKLTRKLSHIPKEKRRNLSGSGIIQFGASVKEGDILVGKFTATQDEPSSYSKLVQAIYQGNSKQGEDNKINEMLEFLSPLNFEKFKELRVKGNKITDELLLKILFRSQNVTALLYKLLVEQKFLGKMIRNFKTINHFYKSIQYLILKKKELFFFKKKKKTKLLKRVLRNNLTRLCAFMDFLDDLKLQKAKKQKWKKKLLKVLSFVQKNFKNFEENLDSLKEIKVSKQTKKINFRDTSLTAPFGTKGKVVGIQIMRENIDRDSLSLSETGFSIKISIAQIRKIQIGDKLSGRHGNKGVISKILPIQDMPILPDGTSLDILLNPLGVPSRMNVGQLLESLLGLAGFYLGKRFKVRPFDEVFEKEASRVFVNQKLKQAAIKSGKEWLYEEESPGKVFLRDGRTGEFFDNPVSIGNAYILKLIHLVEDKIHARSTGPYSMITEQPLGGKANNGGQRFGEMEVWALEAYGCSHTLQELLTVKSDDIDGRNDIADAIMLGENGVKPLPSISETFVSLIRELNALGLDFQLLKNPKQYQTLSPSKSAQTLTEEDKEKQRIDIFQILETKLKLRSGIQFFKNELPKAEFLQRQSQIKSSKDFKQFEKDKLLELFSDS